MKIYADVKVHGTMDLINYAIANGASMVDGHMFAHPFAHSVAYLRVYDEQLIDLALESLKTDTAWFGMKVSKVHLERVTETKQDGGHSHDDQLDSLHYILGR